MYKGTTLSVDVVDGMAGVAELCFDRQGASVNKLDRLTLQELNAALDAVAANNSVHGLLVSSAKDSFIVGADIFEFVEMFGKSEDDLAAYNAGCSTVFTRLDDLPIPTVAVLDGLALGGGFELALAADYRVMADSAQVGLPEVSLGIFPGYGGTVRLPRVAGMATALDWIVSGASKTAKAALEARAVDQVHPREQAREQALTLLHAAIAGEEDWRARHRRRLGGVESDAAALAQARKTAGRNARHLPAALAAVELIERAAAEGRDQALALESRAFARIAKTQAASSLVGIFLNDQFLKKKGKEYARIARPVRQAAVLGAGIMGGGIAYQSAVRGTPVLMKDIAQKQLDIGKSEAAKLLNRQVEGGRIGRDKADAVLAAIRPTLDYSGFGAVDVVIEAVVENMGLKKKVLAEVEALTGNDAILASNTSSLSIAELGADLRRPQNFVGMHFFNPVPVMPLVEVIRGPRTSPEAVATTVAYAAAMGKTPIVVKDGAGFLVNRILTAYILGFVGLVRDGADFEQVDAAMEAFGWPMGPAYLQDVIGMDTASHVVEIIAAAHPGRMDAGANNAVSLMAGLGRFGQKNGIGFYRYEPDPRGKPVKSPAADTHDILSRIQPHGRRAFTPAEIVERTMLPMVIEAALCLEDGVAESAQEVDMALILGLGFPRHIGGALRYADFLGLRHVVERCDALGEADPLYRPTARMRAMAAAGQTYF
ncbi:fatty acid oxidation complex subunit alpha FadB [Massilia putida]|uniref:fatty acid oxidation complex subunit alpha FadB n=1 Tax=Massilia putida TaxID=1141883 RepID=UPI00095290E7|nr:fatty acid oxidation complex subunit alpha FadB [Massilia putida]